MYDLATYFVLYIIYFLSKIKRSLRFEASRGAAAQSVTVKPTGCDFDPHSRR